MTNWTHISNSDWQKLDRPTKIAIAHRLSRLEKSKPQANDDERFDWSRHARPSQRIPEGAWRVWLILAGRGFGKTRTGNETVRAKIERGEWKRVALVAPTAADARDVMVEGDSGMLNVCPPSFRPLYEPSKRRLTWPNGAIATLYSADEPERLRGPQHDGAWCDELAAWRRPEAWDMLMFGLRIGDDPRCIVTTTPKPTKIIKELKAAETTAITVGSTYENRENLAPAFFEQIVRQYEGTRLGRQELQAEILDDNPGALWTRAMIEESRIAEAPVDFARVVVGVDPAVTSDEGSAETGIVVSALGTNGEYYVLDDRSLRASPRTWASAAITAYYSFQADRIIGEVNNGGDMIEALLRNVDENVSYKKVTATRGKQLRAEPIAGLYERGVVHHVGAFPALEDQCCEWVPGEVSPDRLDALVWALTELSAGAYYLPFAEAGEAREAWS